MGTVNVSREWVERTQCSLGSSTHVNLHMHTRVKNVKSASAGNSSIDLKENSSQQGKGA